MLLEELGFGSSPWPWRQPLLTLSRGLHRFPKAGPGDRGREKGEVVVQHQGQLLARLPGVLLIQRGEIGNSLPTAFSAPRPLFSPSPVIRSISSDSLMSWAFFFFYRGSLVTEFIKTPKHFTCIRHLLCAFRAFFHLILPPALRWLLTSVLCRW